ncbi:MAG: hypothetical protein ACKPKO_25430, partial [Candidatus Fonsibacter sp.]
GDGKGLRLKASCKQKGTDLNFESDTGIPAIKKNESAFVTLPVSAGVNVKDQLVDFVISVYEPNGFGLDEFTMQVQTYAARLPKLDVVDHNVSSKSGKLIRKEAFELSLLVQNVGQGVSMDASVNLMLPENTVLLSGNPQVQVQRLAPNASQLVKYELILNQLFSGSEIPVKVEMRDASGQTYQWSKSFMLDQ